MRVWVILPSSWGHLMSKINPTISRVCIVLTAPFSWHLTECVSFVPVRSCFFRISHKVSPLLFRKKIYWWVSWGQEVRLQGECSTIKRSHKPAFAECRFCYLGDLFWLVSPRINWMGQFACRSGQSWIVLHQRGCISQVRPCSATVTNNPNSGITWERFILCSMHV